MGLLEFLKLGRFGKRSNEPTKQQLHPMVKRGADPLLTWAREEKLGDGAFGEVFRARHRQSGQQAAIKQVSIDSDEDLMESMAEVSVLAKCSHANITRLMDAFLHSGKLWLCLEFCEFGALDSVMMELDRGLSESQIQFVCLEMTRALHYLHGNGIIHRDLKAGNVLLTSDAVVKLADFGVSAIGDSPDVRRGTFIGSQYWMAPEVMACETVDNQGYDVRADVWSLGVTLIELAQMLPPHHNLQPARVTIRVIKGDPPSETGACCWGFDTDVDVNLKPDLDIEIDTNTDVDTEIDPNIDTKINIVTDVGIETDTDTISGVKTDTDTDIDIGIDTDTNAGTETETNAGFGTGNQAEASGDSKVETDIGLIESLCQELLDEVLTDEDCDPSVPAVVLSVMQDELEALTDGGFDFTIVQLEPGQSQDNAANPTASTATKEAENGTEDPDSVLITKRRVFTDENGNVIVTTTMRTVRKGNEGKLQEQFLSRRAELREQKQRGRAQHKAEAELESLQAAERDRMSARWALEAARADRELEAASQRLQREADAARTPAGERLRARLALEARARRQRAEADESHLGELREVRLRQLGERWRLRQRLAEERSQLETEELRRRLDEQRDALVRRQAEERRGWPRLLKEERAARASNFRDSLRLPMRGSKPITSDDAALQRRLQREFDESEAARTRQSLAELEAKVARELAEFDKRAARQLEDAEREIATRRHQMKDREADQARDIEAAWRQELGELRDRVAAEEEAAAAAAAASFGEVSGVNRHANRP
uniref:Protein kinase domain-containing protein n=1 Tax=Macrostomum lignano TaxID=282301 RepID=A0A1I8G1W8_9PLAT